MKCANPEAYLSVKLVSETGVGTVAAGAVKAGARVVLISGGEGGTGAAALSSIHHAGLPWELGLAEAHQTLCRNGLREMAALETDGKLMTGRDVAVAALLGAEIFGFGTAPLVTLGCRMMRVCNLDTCPYGIATQNPELRQRFVGKPEYVERFMRFVAGQLREIMAKLGARTLDQLIGRADLLKPRTDSPVGLWALTAFSDNRHSQPDQFFHFHLEERADARLGEDGRPITVRNTDRCFGTLLGAELNRRYRGHIPARTVVTEGCGGQSFGAFLPRGLTLSLSGEANDYLGKGLSGGVIAVRPPRGAKWDPDDALIGNVALYGATSGYAFIAGRAGERFCVRNSGAVAVAEGVGDHGCEYMTGGRVVILGPTGTNFAAGMSGGVAYVLDEKHRLYLSLNKQLILVEPMTAPEDAKELQDILEMHAKATGSPLAKAILSDFEARLPDFKKIIPREYKKLISRA